MRLLIIASDPMEFSGVLARGARMQRVSLPVDWARRGSIGPHEALIAANGVGRAPSAAAAVEAALKVFAPDLVVSAGYCGALDPDLQAGEIVVANCVFGEGKNYAATPLTGSATFRVGSVRTVDHVVQTSEEKAVLRRSGACAVDMEAAGVAECARAHGFGFSCVRAITDLAREDLRNDFAKALRPDGHFATIMILGSCLLHPFLRIPELLRLRKRCIRASCALGDFFADCTC